MRRKISIEWFAALLLLAISILLALPDNDPPPIPAADRWKVDRIPTPEAAPHLIAIRAKDPKVMARTAALFRQARERRHRDGGVRGNREDAKTERNARVPMHRPANAGAESKSGWEVWLERLSHVMASGTFASGEIQLLLPKGAPLEEGSIALAADPDGEPLLLGVVTQHSPEDGTAKVTPLTDLGMTISCYPHGVLVAEGPDVRRQVVFTARGTGDGSSLEALGLPEASEQLGLREGAPVYAKGTRSLLRHGCLIGRMAKHPDRGWIVKVPDPLTVNGAFEVAIPKAIHLLPSPAGTIPSFY